MIQMEIEKEARRIEVAIISDIHLGTYGCKAKELVKYLKGIEPEVLVLNGDIIDVWQFSKSYFPKSHLKVIRQIVKMMERGCRVYYLVGNHDEVMRRFVGTQVGNFSIENKLVLKMNGTTTWIFHGDVFDVIMHHSKWLARLGAHGYGILTILNKTVNYIMQLMGKPKLSLSGKIKESVKGSGKASNQFEETVASMAIRKNYNYVICGHTHHPKKKTITNAAGTTTYLNSGDWVDHCTALEYNRKEWKLQEMGPDFHQKEDLDDHDDTLHFSKAILFREMYNDIMRS